MVLNHFREVWAVDFEFHQPSGERPTPICMVAVELKTGRTIRMWKDELGRLSEPPMGGGPDALIMGYYASAEMNSYLALGWELPDNLLDLYAEYRCRVNVPKFISNDSKYGLNTALRTCGLKPLDEATKSAMRRIAVRGEPFSIEEKEGLLNYCEADASALIGLLKKLDDQTNGQGIDIHAALIRGQYVKTVARMEFKGIPIKTQELTELRSYWTIASDHLLAQVNANYGVYQKMVFKKHLFADYLKMRKIPWELLQSGKLRLDEEYFEEMSLKYPVIAPLHELRQTLNKMRRNKLAVGSDGRNRALLGAFGMSTGRNSYKNSQYIFGQPSWLRRLIAPEPGQGLAYIDWCQQEFGIAAGLSRDEAMLEAYSTGDPYLAFGKSCGGIPPDGTKETHRELRNLFKECVLGILYGMKANRLAQRINQPVWYAQRVLDQHRRTYRTFWDWSDGIVCSASLYGKLSTTFGWEINIPEGADELSVRNFPVQGNAADMLRLACILCEEKGVNIVGTLHDAILIEFRLEDQHEAMSAAQDAMAEASGHVLEILRLETDVQKIIFPESYNSERGSNMWNKVWEIIDRLKVQNSG